MSKKTLLLAIASGILLFFSFPKYGLGGTAWIALIPLFFSLRNTDEKKSLLIGFIAGLVCNVGLIYWITFVVVHYGYLPYYVGIFVMLLLAAYLSIYMALFTCGFAYFSSKGIPGIIHAPVLWTCLEYAKSHLFTGFPWENLAYTQYLNHNIIQLADVTGTYGISFIIIFINVTIYDVLNKQLTRKRIIGEVVLAFIMILAIYGYGYLRINEIGTSEKIAETIDVSLIQGNIDQNIKWNPKFQRETINIYRQLSLEERSTQPGLIVWPETAAPFFFQDINTMHNEIVNIARTSGNWILFGSPSYVRKCDDDEECISFLNSAFLLSPQGKVTGRYDKVHLVPYGEYVPLRKWFPFINKLVVGVGDFQSGKGYYPLNIGNHKLGVLICYEGIFPKASRIYKQGGANLLVNITNDAWFGKTSAPFQHLSMTVFRAVENRLFLVRSANTGISAIIDPTGTIVEQSELFTSAIVKGTVKFINKKTVYSTYGDSFVLICMISLICCFIISLRRRNIYAYRNS